MKKWMVLCFACLFSLTACIDDKKTDARDYEGIEKPAAIVDQKSEQVDHFMRHGPAFPIGDSLAEIERNLGKPLKKTVIKQQNIHDKTQIDEILKLYYSGLYLEVYHVTEMKKDITLFLEVTGDQYPIAYGLGIGASRQKVRAALGTPNEQRSDLWRYFGSDFVMGTFEFVFHNDRVSAIRWHFTID
jgi:hypothetical protein